jgi:hypothetical protein
MEPPLLLGHGRPLPLKVVHELAQDLDGVGVIERGAPGDDVGIDETLRIKNVMTVCFVQLR